MTHPLSTAEIYWQIHFNVSYWRQRTSDVYLQSSRWWLKLEYTILNDIIEISTSGSDDKPEIANPNEQTSGSTNIGSIRLIKVDFLRIYFFRWTYFPCNLTLILDSSDASRSSWQELPKMCRITKFSNK